jgi:preprotein translocase subunit Sec61beta
MNRQGGTLREHVVRAGLTLYFEEPWNARRRRWGY